MLFATVAVSSLLFSLTVDLERNIIIGFVNKWALFLLVCFLIIVGFRAYNVGTDTINYFTYNYQMGFTSNSKSEILFDFLIGKIRDFNLSFTVFLLIIASCYYLLFYSGFKKIANVYETPVLFLVLSFLSLFFSMTMGINIIRQGISSALLFYSFSCYLNSEKISKVVLFIVLAVITHITALIPLLLYLFCKLFTKRINIKYFYCLFVLGVIFSAINIGLLNVAPFLKDVLQGSRRSGYLTQSSEIYSIGFKPQFVAFNAIFLVFFVFIKSKLEKKQERKEMLDFYTLLIKYYIVSSFIFFMAFQIPYSDRWGLFSWISIPVLIAPIFSLKFNMVFKTTLTLLFIFIYLFFQLYGNIKY